MVRDDGHLLREDPARSPGAESGILRIERVEQQGPPAGGLCSACIPGVPGYVCQIAKGTTSLWERWTDRLSGDHHYRSNVATCCHQSLAGIVPTSTAYETLRVRASRRPAAEPREVSFVRDDDSGGAACQVHRARAGSYRCTT